MSARRRRKTYKLTAVCVGALVVIVVVVRLILRFIPHPVVPPNAAWLPANPSNRWECIVIHHSASDAGGATRFDKAHRARGWDGLGYDFVIGNGTDTPDGAVEVGWRWQQQKDGAHCKTPDEYYNKHGIGICLVGNFDNYDPTAAQMRSLDTLCTFLSRRFHIAPDHIFTHGGVTHRTACPGKRFELQRFRDQLVALSR